MENISNIQEFTVSDLSKSLKSTIEERFSYIKLKGEVSGFKKHSSGHCYFSLKDEKSVIDAVMWKGNAQKLNFSLKDGLEVMGTGKVTTYAGRSKYQIILDSLKPAGAGALMALLEELKLKLKDEGLFREDIKKPLPFLPKHIGIITSPTGAVIRDILHRLNDRFFPHIYVFPVAVQGDLSARQISYAIRYFNKCDETTIVKRPDIIIVARGGGSIEDLWSFNEEIVARSVAASQIPIISAVGHETDFTLCDFAADKRAPTPTAAAEIATPIKDELASYLTSTENRLRNALHNYLNLKKNIYHNVSQNIPSIKDKLEKLRERLRFMSQNLSYALKKNIWVQRKAYNNIGHRHRKELVISLIHNNRNKNALYTLRLTQCMQSITSNQKHMIQSHRQTISRLHEKIDNGIRNKLKGNKETVLYISKILQNMSYKNVLSRGYAVIHTDKGIITSKAEAKKRNPKRIEFKDGKYNL